MMKDERLEQQERLLYRIEGWIDRSPRLSRYYTEWLQPALGINSAAGLLTVIALHAVAVLGAMCCLTGFLALALWG